jgi:hypothetical protein
MDGAGKKLVTKPSHFDVRITFAGSYTESISEDTVTKPKKNESVFK